MRIVHLSSKKKFRLRRSAKQRWHLLRIMFTQLITHERIKTTDRKARALELLANKVINSAMKVNQSKSKGYFLRHHKGVITTLSASRKLFDEIVPRLRGNPGGYVNRVKLTKIIEHREPEDYVIRGYRRGDGVSTSYVEINLK